MTTQLTRRAFLGLAAGAVGTALAAEARGARARKVRGGMIEYQVTRSKRGMAVGQPLAVEAAAAVLAAGGNAVDAAVTAGLVSGVVAPGGNGIGGYGGHLVVAMRGADPRGTVAGGRGPA